MNIKDKGFVLRKTEYGDYDFIATFYTEKIGKTSLIIKNARKSKKRFIGRLEPFNLMHLKFRYNINPETSSILNEVRIDSEYNNTGLSKETIILCSLVNEYIDAFEINEVPKKEAFQIIQNFFSKISTANHTKVLERALNFQLSYLTSLGLKPTPLELEKIDGEKIELSKSKLKNNNSSKLKLIRILAKFSQFHSGKELNSVQYLDLL